MPRQLRLKTRAMHEYEVSIEVRTTRSTLAQCYLQSTAAGASATLAAVLAKVNDPAVNILLARTKRDYDQIDADLDKAT
mgnify:CR=1 FL=1